jgi:acid phosphatase type 7
MKQGKRLCLLLTICFALLASHQLPGQENNAAKLRFVVYGDTRTNDSVHRRVVAAAVRQQPAFIIQTGDLVEDSSIEAQWATFDNAIQPIRDKHIAYYPAKGNHDVIGKAFLKEILDPVQPGYDGKNYYFVDVGGLRFISLDTESLSKDAVALSTGPFSKSANCEDAKSAGVRQFCWLKEQLEEARTKKISVVPFFHRALFSVGNHGSDIGLRNLLHPLFQQYGVRLVFQGHDHLYYRTIRDGITYIVTGGGGAPLYAVKSELMQKGDFAKSVHHLCLAELSAGDIHIIVYEIKGKNDAVEPIDDFTVSLAAGPQKEAQDLRTGAGDRDRTGDVQLGKLAFYH